jgi:hypothetical protein
LIGTFVPASSVTGAERSFSKESPVSASIRSLSPTQSLARLLNATDSVYSPASGASRNPVQRTENGLPTAGRR